ncbi:MAG TPA: hypothetical protein PLX14_12510, partial [Anaerolineales bacterium]|nr:hypothetical protein [Anaerolineales bacterium]
TIELNKINSELPLALKSGNTNIDLDSEKRIFYSNYIESVINSDKYLNLHILLNDSVSIEGIENAFNSQSFYCLMSENICFIFNRNDTLFGRLENPIGSEADLKYYLQELQTLFYWLHLHDSDEQRKYLQAVFKLENLKYVRSIENSKTVIVQLPYDSDFFYSPRG